jgi:hypothetical protein
MALIRLIGTERNPHRLLIAVAADAKLLDEARRLIADGDVVTRAWAEILKSQGVTPEFFRERLGLINRTLNLVEHEDHYSTLGLDRTASPDEVKAAFRLLSLSCHPDVAPDDPEAAECFIRIRRAYEVLSDSGLRSRHDSQLDGGRWNEAEESARKEEAVRTAELIRRPQRRALWQIGACVALLVLAALLIEKMNWFGDRYPQGSRIVQQNVDWGSEGKTFHGRPGQPPGWKTGQTGGAKSELPLGRELDQPTQWERSRAAKGESKSTPSSADRAAADKSVSAPAGVVTAVDSNSESTPAEGRLAGVRTEHARSNGNKPDLSTAEIPTEALNEAFGAAGGQPGAGNSGSNLPAVADVSGVQASASTVTAAGPSEMNKSSAADALSIPAPIPTLAGTDSTGTGTSVGTGSTAGATAVARSTPASAADASKAQTSATGTSDARPSASESGGAPAVPSEPPAPVGARTAESFLETLALRKWALDILWPIGATVGRRDDAESDPASERRETRKDSSGRFDSAGYTRGNYKKGKPQSREAAGEAPEADFLGQTHPQSFERTTGGNSPPEEERAGRKKRRTREVPADTIERMGPLGSPTTLRPGNASDGGESAATRKRIDAFLKRYSKAYNARNIPKILSFFDTDARENGRSVVQLAPIYHESFGRAKSIYYRIVPTAWSASKSEISLQGEFHLRVRHGRKRSVDSTGTISMVLVPWGDSYRIKKLDTRTDGETTAVQVESVEGIEAVTTKKQIDTFLERYTKAYNVRDVSRVLGFFDPNAVENGKPFESLAPLYRDNFGRARFIDYRIEPSTWSGSESEISLHGEFRLRVQYEGELPVDSTGTISITLIPWGDGHRIRKLYYRFEKSVQVAADQLLKSANHPLKPVSSPGRS